MKSLSWHFPLPRCHTGVCLGNGWQGVMVWGTETLNFTVARAERKEVICNMRAGDGLLMRPLLLHASSEATLPNHRRVIHLEYATCPLAGGLEWAERIGAA